jgi:hypothetical protein
VLLAQHAPAAAQGQEGVQATGLQQPLQRGGLRWRDSLEERA